MISFLLYTVAILAFFFVFRVVFYMGYAVIKYGILNQE